MGGPGKDRYKLSSKLQRTYPQFEIGRGSYGIPEVIGESDDATLRIGKFCSIADNVRIFIGGEHRLDWVTTYPFNVLWGSGHEGHPATKGDVVIGNDVWIASHVTILSGISIGDGAVLAANSVVVKDVAPYSIVGGNPAKTIRSRFEPEIVEALRRIAWWNWSDELIASRLDLLLSDRIEEFIAGVDGAGDSGESGECKSRSE